MGSDGGNGGAPWADHRLAGLDFALQIGGFPLNPAVSPARADTANPGTGLYSAGPARYRGTGSAIIGTLGGVSP